MADTDIEWADKVWNPVRGCEKVSPGCANCYIERTPPMRMAGRRFVRGEIPVLLHPERLEEPLRWRKPRMVFTCSMADLFHADVPDAFIASIFGVMATASRHTFQVLTKRPQRMRELLISEAFWAQVGALGPPSMPSFTGGMVEIGRQFGAGLRNVWLGVSVENQRWADERIPILLDTPAVVRFLACEPLLSGLDLRHLRCNIGESVDMVLDAFTGRAAAAWSGRATAINLDAPVRTGRIDWLICGGESGGPEKRRLVEQYASYPAGSSAGIPCWRPKPQALEWVRSIRDQCQVASVPFFFKQWPIPPRKPGGLALIDGREWSEMPDQTAQHGEVERWPAAPSTLACPG